MLRPVHPEVLAKDWLPHVLIGRNAEIDRLRRWLIDPSHGAVETRTACVLAPPGSGSSAVARRAALEVSETVRCERGGPAPQMVSVHVRWCTGSQGVAGELLRKFDAGFEPHGFPVAEILAGFLRRVLRDGRPIVVVLDDIGPDAPDLSAIIRALVAPVRFLPEGVNTPPRIWLILAGATDAQAAWARAHRAGMREDREVVLPEFGPTQVEAILRDRAMRALGRPPPEAWLARLVGRVAGGTLARAVERLQKELTDPIADADRDHLAGRGRHFSIERRMIVALDRAASNGPISLRDLRAAEQKLAQLEGVRPMPTTTFWRRIVRLESVGIIRREVRPGGQGGTLSRLELLRPVAQWAATTTGNPRVSDLGGRFAVVEGSASGPAHGIEGGSGGPTGPPPG